MGKDDDDDDVFSRLDEKEKKNINLYLLVTFAGAEAETRSSFAAVRPPNQTSAEDHEVSTAT